METVTENHLISYVIKTIAINKQTNKQVNYLIKNTYISN